MLSSVIIWDINPEAFRIGSVPMRYYGILFALGMLVAYLIEKKIFIKEKVSLEKLDSLLMYMLIGTLLGARLGHCLFYDFAYYKDHLLEVFIPFQKIQGQYKFVGFMGLASHGGAIGILGSIALYCKRYKINVFWLLDRLSIAMPFTAGFIRLGNLMNSEIYGKPTNGNWGVVFTLDDQIPRHPTQLYEALSYLLIGILLWVCYKNKLALTKGLLFGLFLFLMFTTRFMLEFYKENQVDFEQGMLLNMGQILSIPFMVVGVGLMLYSWKYNRKQS